MDVSPLRIEGSWALTPHQFPDERGLFAEYFVSAALERVTGHRLDLHQANLSVSAAGVVRGVHFAELPPSQAKYVTCPHGAVLDVVVDLRVGSPTYGEWESVLLDDTDRRAVYLSEGLGHAFMSLADASVVTYLCSAPYAPDREHGITPLDTDLAIDWPRSDRAGRAVEPLLSAKDTAAPTLRATAAAGLLPSYEGARAYRRLLAGRPVVEAR